MSQEHDVLVLVEKTIPRSSSPKVLCQCNVNVNYCGFNFWPYIVGLCDPFLAIYFLTHKHKLVQLR